MKKMQRGRISLPIDAAEELCRLLKKASRLKRLSIPIRREISVCLESIEVAVRQNQAENQVAIAGTIIVKVLRYLPLLMSVHHRITDLFHVLIGEK